ncbi:type 4 pilus major pilin [Xanthomonas campestris]|uniref:type 4 pilus major pilin n=1 Tax=Xanthomonas campestris TaxID=339 RepID=UPI00236568B0|nr:type 4 pilus major pilin [Xanthomonas campestris]MEA0759653.1 type 4 pilus major pilin [Xanthomonas campestris pv. campestris]MEB1221900.1 type 4 pilus major pilin [Xanthomonas campestris pv. campestris]MEB1242250.1 type 4 pilus major pilin [Xanthomonas campestris pv. campestris]MEB1250625.1 type 4 pilus major pilin [Xanthomonas campestris pv. campestris]MEB1291980.1 type 4 pilus major pilin [Xanthomonas campestris pv. campestris]
MSDDKKPTDPLLEQQREALRAHFLGSLGDLLDARRKRKAECPTPPPSAPRGQKPGGYTLVEVLLVLAAMSAMAAAGWLLFGPTSVAADVKQTQMDFSETATAIDRSLGIVGGFSGLSTSLVQTDGLAAQRLRQSDGLRNAWGGSVSFLPNTVKRGNDSFLVETRDVPKAACAKLVAAMAADPAVSDARVNGESVYSNNKYDPATAAVACERDGGDRMGFVYFSGLASGSSVAALPPTLPPAPPSLTPTNPTTPVGAVDGAPDVDDATPGTPGVVPPGPPATQPPAVPTTPPAPATPTNPPPTPGVLPPNNPPPLTRCTVPPTQTQNVNCPAGQIGTVTQQRVGYCGEVGGPYEAWATASYGPWSTVNSTCAPACVAPSPTSVAIARDVPAESQNVGCPAGQVGEHWQQRTRVENGTRTTSWTCLAATGSPVSSTSESWSGTYTATSGWVTTSNTCATPAPAYQYSIDSMTTLGGACGLRIQIRSSGLNGATGSFVAIGTLRIDGRESDRTYTLSTGSTIVLGSSTSSYSLTFRQEKNPGIRTNNIIEYADRTCP